MGKFVKGDVVVIPFPFSDLSEAKRRPALVVATLEGSDLILCQITSRAWHDAYAVLLDEADFSSGRLNVPSHIRPNRLFTADSGIIIYGAGHINRHKMDEVTNRIVEILQR